MKLIIPLEIWVPPVFAEFALLCRPYQEQIQAPTKWLAGALGVIIFLKMNSDDESCVQQDEEVDQILELAVDYAVRRSYPPGLTKERKRAVRKRASTLVVDKGEVFLKKKGRRVKVVTAVEEQRRILESCHSDPTSGHFGTTKTWRRVAERFYWRGMSKQVKELVSRGYEFIIYVHFQLWLSSLPSSC